MDGAVDPVAKLSRRRRLRQGGQASQRDIVGLGCAETAARSPPSGSRPWLDQWDLL